MRKEQAATEPEAGSDPAPPRTAAAHSSYLAPETQAESRSSGRFTMAAALMVALMLGGIGTGLIPFLGSDDQKKTAPPVPVPSIAVAERGSVASLLAPSPVPSMVQPVATGEIQKALGEMLITERERLKLQAEVESGEVKLGWLAVSDFVEQDGDWVTISAAGYAQKIRLWHSPTTVAVAYPPGGHVTVTGEQDGGGGITVAVHIGASKVPLAPMSVGTSVQVPTP